MSDCCHHNCYSSCSTKGERGDRGERGPTGEKGDRGEKGKNGDSGDRGPRGFTGDRGERGPSGPTGPTGAQGPSGAQGLQGESSSGSVIPFSSGILGPTAITSLIPYVIGFGSGSPIVLASADLLLTLTQFAFVVPEDGTLHDLNVSGDVRYLPFNVFGAITYTFTVMRSPTSTADPPVAVAYSDTTLTVPITFPATDGEGLPSTVIYTKSGSNTGSIAVSKGDRITIRINCDQLLAALSGIASVGFSASVMFT